MCSIGGADGVLGEGRLNCREWMKVWQCWWWQMSVAWLICRYVHSTSLVCRSLLPSLVAFHLV